MGKLKKIFTNWRVILVLIAVLMAVVAIHPNPTANGVAIRGVAVDSAASLAGIESPEPTATPMSRERIIAMNNVVIEDVTDYYDFVSELKPNRTVHVKTDAGLYKLTTKEEVIIETINGTEEKEITEQVFNETLNKTVNLTKIILVNKTKTIHTGVVADLGFAVYQAPQTNIRKGLDLQGGTRVLLQPEEVLDADQMGSLIANMERRLNVYGLSDLVIKQAGDLSGNQYILVEIAGAKEDEAKELLTQQGKFEAKIANQTVFSGGEDITYVCRSADCSGIDPTYGCGKSGDAWICKFRFAISLSPAAAENQAALTGDLDVVNEEGQDSYLSDKLQLYLDDVLVDELNIGADLKGRAVTDIQISGSGAGETQADAQFNALENMKQLRTIIETGSLPVKINMVKTDTISAIFGEEYLKNSMLIGLLAIASVGLIAFIRYRRLVIALPMLLTSIAEVVMLLGFAAFAGQYMTLDLAAIAGIIIAVGTGVDHIIVITDETLTGGTVEVYDWKKRIKRAMFIIMAAYLTTLAAMLPLLKAGAGLLRGFALTTIVGVTIGVFIARPAFAAVIEILLKD